MSAPEVQPLPEAPSPSDSREEFNSKAYPFVAALSSFGTSVNQLVAWMNANISARPVLDITAAESDLSPSQTGGYLRFTFDGSKTFNILSESSGAQPEGAVFFLTNTTAGDLTLVPGSGVVLSSAVVLEQGASLILQRVAEDTYDVVPIGGEFTADLSGLAPLASPAFTGTPTAPTPPESDDSESVSTTEYVQRELLDRLQTIENVASLSGYAPIVGRLYRLKEYNLGTGKAGGDLLAKSGVIIPNNVTTFASATAGVYFERVNTVIDITHAGAVLDGTTDDKAAVLRFVAATNGILKAPRGECFIGNMILPDYNQLVIIGAGAPQRSGALSKLEGGTIFIGGISARSTYLHLQDFGIDDGSDRGVTGAVDGGVFNSRIGVLGVDAVIKNVVAIGRTEENPTHAILVQGFEGGSATGVYCAEHQYGLVVKCRNFNIDGVRGNNIKTALVYPKSDIPAFGGDVVDATAANFNISNVHLDCDPANTIACAVYLHASTAAFASARVSNVNQTFGGSALRIQGSGLVSDPAISAITASNITGNSGEYAVLMSGFNYDVKLDGITAINPSTGRAIFMDTGSTGWHVNNVSSVISDAAITGDVVVQFQGTGVWDNISARNPYRTMLASQGLGSFANIKSGVTSGDCKSSVNVDLTGHNGSVPVSGIEPKLILAPGSKLTFTGRFDLSASTNKSFCQLTFSTGKQVVQACGAITTVGDYTTVAVRFNTSEFTIEPGYAGIQYVDLSGFIVHP